MPVAKQERVEKKENHTIIVTDKVRSYADEPFFVKKEEKAKEFMRNHPLPKKLKK